MLKHLLCRYEDPSLIPSTHIKLLSMLAFWYSVLGKQRQVDPWDSLATNLDKLARSRIVKNLVPKSKVDGFLRSKVGG